ncbi:hypothetical protein [Nocardia concava]|uniref:hypothetical protein n=1 Tax=Nocardia concava TaxID=257281 RepID=UPI0002F9894D|nr:hypothetical protein [Nocardia concava]
MGIVKTLWETGRVLGDDALYRADDTGLELFVEGPGAYHPDAGQPIPFRLGEPFDVAEDFEADDPFEECFWDEVDVFFDIPLPDGSGRTCGGGAGGMGNKGFLARLDADGSLRWVAYMYLSNPFINVRYEGTTAIFTNDWRNCLTLNLTSPALL